MKVDVDLYLIEDSNVATEASGKIVTVGIGAETKNYKLSREYKDIDIEGEVIKKEALFTALKKAGCKAYSFSRVIDTEDQAIGITKMKSNAPVASSAPVASVAGVAPVSNTLVSLAIAKDDLTSMTIKLPSGVELTGGAKKKGKKGSKKMSGGAKKSKKASKKSSKKGSKKSSKKSSKKMSGGAKKSKKSSKKGSKKGKGKN